MGYTSYSSTSRTMRATTDGYYSKGRDEIFTQNKKREMHEQMNPANVLFRESCDSETHPNTVPIQLYLDVTGSMREIPHEFIKDGLPTMIGTLIQSGISDPALMFAAVGDHEYDACPLQVAQFESGDEELDMWLKRVYLEGGGGPNAGESYLLAWYFAANHVKTDAFDKRGRKGYVFTIGDEPNLTSVPKSALSGLMKESVQAQSTLTADGLLKEAQEKNYVYHIHVNHNSHSSAVLNQWKNKLGQNCVEVQDYHDIAKTIADIILSNEANYAGHDAIAAQPRVDDLTNSTKEQEIML